MSDRFYRDRSQAAIAGVCAGLAQYFGVSPTWLRIIFVLVALSGGPAVAAYLILWILLPEKTALGRGQEQAVQANLREIRSEAVGIGEELQAILDRGPAGAAPSKRLMWLGAILVVMGLASLADHLNLLGWMRLDQLWPVALILAGIVLAHRAVRRM